MAGSSGQHRLVGWLVDRVGRTEFLFGKTERTVKRRESSTNHRRRRRRRRLLRVAVDMLWSRCRSERAHLGIRQR